MGKDNLDKILNQTFKYAKEITKEFYFKEWKPNAPKCPAFDGETIHISHHGWDHLIYDKERTKFELLGRLFVLERVKYLLEIATNFQDYIRRADTEFWSFEAKIDKVKIKVIIRSIKGGERHFYSVIRKGSIKEEIKKEIREIEQVEKNKE